MENIDPKIVERLNQITAKEEHALTPVEIKFLKARKGYLTRDQKKKFATALKFKEEKPTKAVVHKLTHKELLAKAGTLGTKPIGMKKVELEAAIKAKEAEKVDLSHPATQQ